MATKQVKVVRRRSREGGTTKAAITNWFRQYVSVRDQRTSLQARETELKDKLKDVLLKQGYEDNNGHLWFDLPGEVEGYSKLQAQRRVSQRMDTAAAEELIAKKGLEKSCLKTITVVDEDALAQAVFEGSITEKEFDALIQRSVTYAFVPTK